MQLAYSNYIKVYKIECKNILMLRTLSPWNKP